MRGQPAGDAGQGGADRPQRRGKVPDLGRAGLALAGLALAGLAGHDLLAELGGHVEALGQ